MARCRPLPFGYDCITVEHGNDSVVTHDGRVHRDGRTLYIVHSRFCLDKVFGVEDDNDKVFNESMKPLIDHCLLNNQKKSTLLLFGQTGTGKTYT